MSCATVAPTLPAPTTLIFVLTALPSSDHCPRVASAPCASTVCGHQLMCADTGCRGDSRMEPSRADSQTFAASLAPRGMASTQSSTRHIQNREGRSPQPQPNSPDSDHLVRYPLAILVTLPRHVKPLSGT